MTDWYKYLISWFVWSKPDLSFSGEDKGLRNDLLTAGAFHVLVSLFYQELPEAGDFKGALMWAHAQVQ